MAYGAHSYWRARWPSRGGSYVNLYEAVFLDANLKRRGIASDTGGTPIQSGNFGGYPLSQAFDENSSTLWSGSDGGGPDQVWIGVKLTTPVAMARFSASGDSFNCVIEYSDDGITWTNTGVSGANSNLMILDDFVETKATGPHAYWRCLVVKITSNSYASLAAMDFRDSGGSISLSGGTPFASQELTPGGTYAKAKAFDGDINSFWLSQGSPFPSLGYQFASGVLPTELKLTSRNDGFGPSESWQAFAVQYSDDGTTWTLQSFYEDQGWGAGELKTFDLTYVAAIPEYLHVYRLRSTSPSVNGVAISAGEIEFHETIGGPDVTGSGAPYSRYMNPSYPDTRAFDDDLGNFWLSNNMAAQIGYNFGAETVLSEYAISPRNGYADESMSSWVLEASDGEGGWLLLDTRTGQGGSWTSGVWRSFSFTPPDGGGGPDPEPTGRRRYTFAA